MKALKCLFIVLFCLTLIYGQQAVAQRVEPINHANIKTVRLHTYGDQFGLPAINLNSGDRLELHFDDVDADIKYYYYTYQLCDIDWKPVNVSQFDYIKGFTQVRLNNYRISSLAIQRYTHYQATLPERNSIPSRSGNYLLKVFLDGDTSKLVFTRRLLVLDSKSSIAGQIVQPFTPKYFRTHQKVQFRVDIKGLNSFTPNREIKVVLLQNNRWDNAITNIAPTFVRGTTLEYTMEDNTIFPAGKEWRWLDLRDVRLQSDRVERGTYGKAMTEMFLRPDKERSSQRYVYYRDLNGMYLVETTTSVNPYWQSEYAMVHFRYLPPFNKPIEGKDLYLFGQLTNYELNDSLKMKFDAHSGLYETKLFMKQGYYNYTYIAQDQKDRSIREELDGNNNEAENVYTILVYFKSFTARADELIGVAKINSRTDRPAFSF